MVRKLFFIKWVSNSLNLISRTVRVGLGTTVADTGLQIGQIVSQPANNATGRLKAYR